MSERAREDGTSDGANMTVARPPLSLFEPRPVAVWVVLALLLVIGVFSIGLFFESVAPVADFWFQPYVEADSSTYWELSGVKPGAFTSQSRDRSNSELGNNVFGPVLQARIFRNEFGVMLSNLALFVFMLWIVGTMKEFDRGMFTFLLLLNPLLISAILTLNKEIFSILGMIVFVRYMTAKRYRGLLLLLALVISFAARWQQMAAMLVLACLSSHVSPFRNKPKTGIAILVLLFTLAYTAVYKLAPVLIAGLLAQAEAGHTIVVLDRIQGNFGFPLVVLPKIMLNVMGRFITPKYFLSDYWDANFSNWYDQIFTQMQELLTTVLLLFMLVTRRLKLENVPVYLLAFYLILTAVNPMVQPRYEYPAYVLLCLEASRYFRLDGRYRWTKSGLSSTNAMPA
jgi:hypothetical protein